MASQEHVTIVRALPAAITDILDEVGYISRCERCEAGTVARRIAIRNYDNEKRIPIRRL